MSIEIPKSYDSEFCGSIPIHLINLVQSYGFMVIVENRSVEIVQVSENVIDFLKVPPVDILKKNIKRFVSEGSYEKIVNAIEGNTSKDYIEVQFLIAKEEKGFYCLAHVNENFTVLEMEPIEEHGLRNEKRIFLTVKDLLAATRNAMSVREIANVTAKKVKELTGFHKVMVYQFDPEWNGSVIAEEKEADLDSYLGLRFPASDIPQQARNLYLNNSYRMIWDVDQPSKSLVPVLNPLTNSFTDLSGFNLRSVPAVHIQYLKNMKVGASMSVPIVVDNKLWGLISCHHKTSKLPHFELRANIELVSHTVAMQIFSKEKEISLTHRTYVNDLKGKIVEAMFVKNDFLKGITANPDILNDLFEAEGWAIVNYGDVLCGGNTPNVKEIKNIVVWLQRNKVNTVFSTHHFPKLYEPAQVYKDTGSGLLAISLSPKNGNYILVFKPEVIQTVQWGGDPNQAVNFLDDGKSYNPRNSFEIWKETVRFTSTPWMPEHIEVAGALRTSIFEILLNERTTP